MADYPWPSPPQCSLKQNLPAEWFGHIYFSLTERPDVCRGSVPSLPFVYHLRGHVLQRPREGGGVRADPSQSLARPEVGYLHHAAVSIDEDVVALDIAMDDLLIVKVLETFQYLLGIVGDGPLLLLQCSPLALEEGGKRPPGDLLHDDLEEAVLRERAQVLDNVPVAELGVEDDLLVEGLHVPDVLLGDLLDRHTYLSVEVSGGELLMSVHLISSYNYQQTSQRRRVHMFPCRES